MNILICYDPDKTSNEEIEEILKFFSDKHAVLLWPSFIPTVSPLMSIFKLLDKADFVYIYKIKGSPFLSLINDIVCFMNIPRIMRNKAKENLNV